MKLKFHAPVRDVPLPRRSLATRLLKKVTPPPPRPADISHVRIIDDEKHA